MAFTAGRGGTTTPRYSASMSEYSKSPKASRLPRKATGSESSTQVRSRSNFSSKRSEAAGNLCSGQKKLERGRGNPRKRYFRYPDARQIKIVEDGIFWPKAGWIEMVMRRPIEGKIRTSRFPRSAATGTSRSKSSLGSAKFR